VPFSIDAALQGTISNYTPSNLSKVVNAASPSPLKAKSALKKPAQPDSWFFDIHEDTPEQEATNLLFHNASVLDISSDDDAETMRAKDAAVRGKENVPPPEYVGMRGRARDAAAAVAVDAMVEDRRPLGEMDVKKFWKDDGEEEQVVLVEEKEEERALQVPHNSPQKETVAVAAAVETEVAVQVVVDQEFVIFKDETASNLVV
jgi:hypothetical protein